MGWYLSQKDVVFPRYPLRNGLGFQIRSQLAKKRALFWHEHIGGGQYRLRIRTHNPGNNKQWFIFDQRTNTIRTMANRKMAISIQAGGNNWFGYGYGGVVRPYKGQNTQLVRWYRGAYKNIRDIGVRCLDVHGGHDHENRYTIWYKCHNGANQKWRIDTKGVSYPMQPLASGVKFQIRSRMAENRALYAAEHIGGNQYRLRI